MKCSSLGFASSVVCAMVVVSESGLAEMQGKATVQWTAPKRYKKRVNPLVVDKGVLRLGRKIYRKECESCHGVTGKGDGKAASGLELRPRDLSDGKVIGAQTDGELFYKIRAGKRPMPTFQADLSSKDIWAVIHYVRTLAPSGKKSATEVRWHRGKPPKLGKEEGSKLHAGVEAWLRALNAAQVSLAGGTKNWPKDRGRLDAGLTALGKVVLSGRAGVEVAAWRGHVKTNLDGVLVKGTIHLEKLSAVNILTASLLGRYSIRCQEVWALYHYADKKVSVDWLQPRSAKQIHLVAGFKPERSTISKTFPVTVKIGK